MALINRISRLFQADMHAVLDRIEEPEALLRQALREMEAAHADDSQRARLLQHEQDELAQQATTIHQQLERLDGELDLCFEAGKEVLARKLVRQKLERAELLERMQSRDQRVRQQLVNLQRRMQENSTRLESLRQKLALLQSEQNSQGFHNRDSTQVPVRDEEVEVAFMREQQKRRSS
ncbi:MAG: PspA/IM30 family protein [Sedimenticola sp.]|nr:PspA/IM30 family protein [Sedimenticola sp.]